MIPNEQLRRSHLYWQLLFYGLSLIVAFLLLRKLESILLPIAASLLLAYIMDPFVAWMTRRLNLPRWLGSLIIFGAGVLALLAILLFLIPLLIHELTLFIQAIPDYLIRTRDAVVPWVERKFKVTIPANWNELFNAFGADLKEFASKLIVPLSGIAGKFAEGAASALSNFWMIILIPVFTFYFLVKFPVIIRSVQDLIPRRYLALIQDVFQDVDHVLAHWIRGQLSVMAALACFYAIALSIVGIKMALLIGVLTGLLAFIPYIGVAVGFSMAMLVCLLEYNGLGQILGVVLVFGIAQVVDGLFFTPFFVGGKVGLGPIGVLLALMVGGNLFGFVGVLVAVPTSAVLIMLFKRVIVAYKKSRFYKQSSEQETATSAIPTKEDRLPTNLS